MRSFSQLRRELSKNDLFYLDIAGRGTGSTTRSQALIDHSKNAVLLANGSEGVSDSAKKDLDTKLKRVEPDDKDAFYHFGNFHTIAALLLWAQSLLISTDEMTMTGYSRSRSGSTELDRLTILSKSETPTPPMYSDTDTGARHVNETLRRENGGRKSILNSWNEGISLEETDDSNDRLEVAFEGKLLTHSFAICNFGQSDLFGRETKERNPKGV